MVHAIEFMAAVSRSSTSGPTEITGDDAPRRIQVLWSLGISWWCFLLFVLGLFLSMWLSETHFCENSPNSQNRFHGFLQSTKIPGHTSYIYMLKKKHSIGEVFTVLEWNLIGKRSGQAEILSLFILVVYRTALFLTDTPREFDLDSVSFVIHFGSQTW